VPRLVEALAGKKVIGAAVGSYHTAVWTHSLQSASACGEPRKA